MIIDQVESVFARNLLLSKQWIEPKGQVQLLPKSEGNGYMLSAFVLRGFGFGRKMTDDELQNGQYRKANRSSRHWNLHWHNGRNRNLGNNKEAQLVRIFVREILVHRYQ
jgi:hypothetical protein